MIVSKHLLLSETLDNGQGESDGLSWTCAVSGDHVEALVNELEGFVLDWEELFDAFFSEGGKHSFIFDEISEIAFVWLSGFLNFDWFRVNVSEFSFFLIVDFGDLVAGFTFGHGCCWFNFWNDYNLNGLLV